ncbi:MULTISPECIES: ABC transporter ATP-binding protein [unclassified Ruegeria]|uniref:ABC transporter ATP-binding protein n=1 Tax=unclassified Ruegeria TaxID=2625375 RepID=UPI001490E1A7|nr:MULTISPECIES: ABC transporter ATP-binding protein [unclassified Ruegeria]NOD47365.1 ATP-binding cassette domain-containing protein [Ruegeria sp. HKCCD5849]NOD53242.1 ATP-binding cassette domain-containing protein [Ruegeria sp. HKCCD5851]NOD66435.1 ATP-binding cassette domain-containing protein [Ruegeria sp. HKCCD7303]
MTDKALSIDHVLKDRGKTRVLDDITLSLASGQRVALLGHNGAGKSTLIKSILGLTPINGGTIRIGEATPGSAQARRETAYLPEAVSFHPALTGREQLTLFAKLSGAKADVPGLLERVGLSDALDRRIGAYSKGMRQRLGLAQVLLGQPKVALLDEPTSGLDPISRQDLYAIIDELAAQGTAVLIASHALTEVEARTDLIAIMRKGQMVADDTLNNLSALAGLPIRLKVRASVNADALAAELGGSRINGASVELLCSPADKMEALRRIAGMGDAVADVEMTPPNLEDLYRHYAQEELK